MTRAKSRCRLLLFAIAMAIAGCSQNKRPPLLELLDSGVTGINFSNTLKEDEQLNIITYEYMYNGAGVGIADINNDGLKDILFTANMSENKLYLNKGDFHFEDITSSSGLHQSGKWATGVSVIDINQDGWTDLYICYSGPYTEPSKRANELYINNKDNTFTEQAEAYGLSDTGHSIQAAFFDYDRDGDLDLYLLTNTTDRTGPNVIRPKRLKGEMNNTDRLYRNNGDRTFTNVSTEAGILAEGYGLGVSICDFNTDGWPDVYVSNDYLSNDLLYINNRNGTFTDRAGVYFDHTSYSAMGNDVGDFNNDGLADIVSVDMLPPDNKRQKLMFGATNYDRYRSEIKMGYTPQFMRNTLQLGRGKDTNDRLVFSEIGQLAGISATDWSWSPLFADIDNDGWRDLLITNGYPRDITNRDFANYKASEFMRKGYAEGLNSALLVEVNKLEGAYLPNFAFRNNGDLTFSDSSSVWGFSQPSYSTGAAYADLDNDGDLDYVTNNTNEVASVYRNNCMEEGRNHYIAFQLEGPDKNRAGFGTHIVISASGKRQYVEHYPYRGFQSTVDDVIHFGVGRDSIVSSVRVEWPDGKVQQINGVESNQTLRLSYENAQVIQSADTVKSNDQYFRTKPDGFLTFRHAETHYADFKVQPLLPQKYSQNGPGMAVADVNGDGLDDFFVGGAYNQPGVIHIQKKDGSFIPKALTTGVKYEEDMGAVFIDIDLDADQDLYVVSGGNEFKENAEYYQDRLYLNDGRGNFAIAGDRVPEERSSGSCVVAADYDRDGDMDLFVGGRIRPQHHPEGGTSFILENRKGFFFDVTDKVAPGLKQAGMVTAAIWTDYNDDHELDLMIVGEWMNVGVYRQKKGVLEYASVAEGLLKTSGWWNSITGADLDADGDMDYVLGNLGTNSRYQLKGRPLVAYVADYNSDGTEEALLSQQINGTSFPAHPRDDLFLQLPSYKKFYTSYKAYSTETMKDLLARTPNIKPRELAADVLQTCVLMHEGPSHWTLKPLPVEAQFGPVYGILADDFTGDGLTDILVTGNSEAPDVLTGKYDALKGLLLQSDGHAEFKPVPFQRSGWMVDGDAKSLVALSSGGGRLVLAAENNDTIKSFDGNLRFKSIALNPFDSYVLLVLNDGRTVKKEIYHGDGYLSQSASRLWISESVDKVTVVDNQGRERIVQ